MDQFFSPVSRGIIICAALIIIIAGMKLAAPMLVPFLLSVFIAVISFPLMEILQRRGLPEWLSLMLVLLLVIITGFALVILIGGSITDFSRMLPEYQQKITSEWYHVIQWLKAHGLFVAEDIKELLNPAAAMSLLSTILVSFGGVLTNSFLIILTVAFILMEASCLKRKIIFLNEHGGPPLPGEGDFSTVFVDKLRNYMSMKTLISVLTGTVIGIAMWLIGLDYPLLWAVLAFMLNFVPNIGSIIAAVPAVMLALVQLGVSSALLVAAVYVAVNVIIGSIIEPKYMGKGLGLSTLVVFASLVFWGWVLGPVGMLLSVPLTITVKLALDSKAETQWLGHMLGTTEA